MSSATSIDIKRAVPWITFVAFFVGLNETVFNVSTPAIERQFDLGPSGVSLIMTTFIVVFAVGTVVYGKLSDFCSLRSLVALGLLLYGIGSALGFAFHNSYSVVIVARATQGAGASVIPALLFVVIGRYIPFAQRGRVFGIVTTADATAIGIGPVVGGFISGTLSWPFLFVLPLFSLIAAPFLLRTLPDNRRRAGKIDVPGALLVAGAVGALMLYLSFELRYFLVVAVVLIGGFVLNVFVSKRPFISLSLLSNRIFSMRVCAAFIVFVAVVGALFMVPLMLSSLRGLSTEAIGLVMFPGAIGSAALGAVAGSLADKRGNRVVVAIGLALLILSFLILAVVSSFSAFDVAAALVLTYSGLNVAQVALYNSVSESLKEGETGIGLGFFNLVSTIAGAVGASLVGRYLASGWLNSFHDPVSVDPGSVLYSNLLILFALLIAIAWVIYFASSRRLKSTDTD